MENYCIIEIKKNTLFNNGHKIIYFHLINLLKKANFL